jgi:hypothetical protein
MFRAHNFKQFILKKQLFQVIFWYGHQEYVCFLQRSIYHRTRRQALLYRWWGDPLQALLEGAVGQQAACQL